MGRLKTDSAKKKNLQQALDALHTDDVPDSLQSAEIDAIEAELRKLAKT